MKVKYIGKEHENFIIENNRMDLIPNKIYEAIKESKRNYTLIDESGEAYAYPKCFFEVISKE